MIIRIVNGHLSDIIQRKSQVLQKKNLLQSGKIFICIESGSRFRHIRWFQNILFVIIPDCPKRHMRHPRKLSGRIITWLFHCTFITPLYFTSTDQTTLSIKCGSILYHFLISLSIHTICIVHLFYLVQRSFFCLLHTLRTDSPPASLKLRKITGH